MQIPWYPPRPADFAPGFGADQDHFCLLARIEADPPWSMQTPEVTNVEVNTRMNNNIAWKNVTVIEPAGGAMDMMLVMRNVFRDNVMAGLISPPPTTLCRRSRRRGDFVDLDTELFKRWTEAGGKGNGIERVGDTRLALTGAKAELRGIELRPGEGFPVTLGIELGKDFTPTREPGPAFDVIQIGAPENPEQVVGGIRYAFDLKQVALVKPGSGWRFSAGGADPDEGWEPPGFDDSAWATGAADFGFGAIRPPPSTPDRRTGAASRPGSATPSTL